MVGLNGINIALGYALASYMGLAFFYQNDPVSQWRSPLGIALIWPALMIGVCFIAPESPRFLLMKGRVEEAKAITLKLHRMKHDPDDEFARGEFYQMAKQAEIDRTLDPGWVRQLHEMALSIWLTMAARDVQTTILSQALYHGYGLRFHRPEHWGSSAQ